MTGVATVPVSAVIKSPCLAFRIKVALLTSPLPISVNFSMAITLPVMSVE